MNILHLPSSFFPGNTGGKEVLVYQWIRNSASPGIKHRVLIHGEQARSYTYHDIEVDVLPMPGPRTRRAYFSKVYSDLGGFKEYLQTNRPDIVHFHDQNESGSLSHLRICKELGVKTMVTYHSPGQSCLQRAQLFAGKKPCDGKIDITRCTSCRYQSKGLPQYLANRLGAIDFPFDKNGKFNFRATTKLFYQSWEEFYREVDKVHIYSRWLEQVLLLNGVDSSKITYTEMGGHPLLELKEESPLPLDDTLRLVFVGRCTPIKGVHLLIDAVQKLPVQLDIEVHFFGPYFDQSDYGRTINEKVKGDKRFKPPRLVPPDQIIHELRMMDVCVIPSLWPETGPLSVFDAFAAQLPIVGTNHAGIAERVKNGTDGLLFEWGNVNDLAEKIRRLAEDPALRLGLKKGIQKKNTFNDMAASVAQIYRGLQKVNTVS